MEVKNFIQCQECKSTCMRSIFDAEDFLLIEENKTEMSYVSGDCIQKQGSFVGQIIFLRSGIVKIVREGSNQRNSVVRLVEAPGYLSLSVLGNPNIYPCSIVTLTPCDACLIRKEAIQTIMERNIKANRYLMEEYTRENEFLYDKIETISTRNSHGKLATALLYLTEYGKKSELLNSISRKDLADFASISLESCNKILMELKNDQIIEIDKKNIVILRSELLETLSTIG